MLLYQLDAYHAMIASHVASSLMCSLQERTAWRTNVIVLVMNDYNVGYSIGYNMCYSIGYDIGCNICYNTITIFTTIRSHYWLQ